MKSSLNDLLQKASADLQKLHFNTQSIKIPEDLSESSQIKTAINNIRNSNQSANVGVASVPKPVVVAYSQNGHIQASVNRIRQYMQSL